MVFNARAGARLLGYLVVSIVVVVICASLASSDPYLGTVIATIAVYGLVSTGLDFIVGWLREISVGQAAAMAVGAYAGQPFIQNHVLLAIVVAALAGMAAGIVIGLPAFRVSGFALATYTLVVGLGVELLLEDDNALGGTAGKTVIPGKLFGLNLVNGRDLVILCVIMLLLGIFVYNQLRNSAVGISWRAVGQNHRMASSLAMNPIRIRLSAFALAGLFAGVAGLLFAVIVGYLSPDEFDFTLSVQFLAMVVIGGRVHPLGATAGAAVFAIYEQYLPASNYNDVVIGGVLALVAWLAPRGLMPYVSDGLRALWRLVRSGGRGGVAAAADPPVPAGLPPDLVVPSDTAAGKRRPR
jgi:ABC-type branched-subunit amino acid transport system permease subunit